MRRKAMKIYGKVIDEKTKCAMAGIAVSDGRSITLTDEEGFYSIETWEKAKLVYLCALTRGHDDWYFNLSSGREEYNFIARFEQSGSDFSFFHSSDIEVSGREELTFNDFMRKEVKSHKPAFYIHGGDIERDEGLRRSYLIMNRETVGCPVRYCIGNHDFRGDDWGESVYEKYYGPTFYSFDLGGVHFVVLSLLQGDKPGLYTREDQQTWLKADLELLSKGQRVFVFCHSWQDYLEWNCGEEPKNSIVNLKDYRYTGCAFGHHHTNLLHEEDGIFYICSSRPDSGGIDSSIAAIRKVSFTEQELSSELIYYGDSTECDAEFEWEAKLDGTVEYGTPIIDSGRVYVATNDDGYPKKCGIYALDFENGNNVWQIPLADGIKGGLLLDEGFLYAQTTHGTLMKIRAADGKLVASIQVSESPTYFNSTTPIAAGDKILAGRQMPIVATDKNLKSVLWTAAGARNSITAGKVLYDPERNIAITGINWSYTCALNCDTGELLWTQNGDRGASFCSSTPIISDGTLYTSGLYSVVKINLEDGNMIAACSTGGSRMDSSGAPADDGDTLYYPTGSTGVIALDKATLKKKLVFPAGKNALFSTPYITGKSLETVEGTPIILGDTLIFADNAGTLRYYDKNTAELKKCMHLGEPITASLAMQDGYLIAAGFFGGIKKIKI